MPYSHLTRISEPEIVCMWNYVLISIKKIISTDDDDSVHTVWAANAEII